MKKIILLLLLVAVPFSAFAVSHFNLNGSRSHTITKLPSDVVMTCDLAGKGNQIEVEIYFDTNGNKEIDSEDFLAEYAIITDGMGWIRDPDNPEEDIAGDETPVDGKIKSTVTYDETDVMFVGGSYIIQLTDKDGSTASGVLTFNVTITPPLIQGRVTEKATGNPIANAFVGAMDQDGEEVFSFTDKDGNYKMAVAPGDYKVMAFEFMNPEHMPSDSVDVKVGEGQTVTQNFQLEKYKAFVDGTLKTEDGTPVAGIRVLGGSVKNDDMGSMATSNSEGYYKIGVVPGRVAVMVSELFNIDVWPADHYVDPQADTLNIAGGETKTVNFVFKKHTSFITGKCTFDGQPLEGVEINAISFDLTGMGYYSTYSKPDGTYKLGVKPGNITMLSAIKDGYQPVSPENGLYMGVQVNPNQTVTGKDFGFKAVKSGNSISGRVTMADDSPAANVYVVAENWNDEEREKSFLTTFTNNNGEYTFYPEIPDEWKIGVFKRGYHSEPAMRYESLWFGPVTDADFMLHEGGTGVQDLADGRLPRQFFLEQNYPNPFHPGFNSSLTKIGFYLPQPAQTDIYIYNVVGQLVHQTSKGQLNPGKHSITWDGRDMNGALVPSGMYFYHVNAGNRVLNKRMIVVR